jgi:hypothetical protein
MQSLVIGSEAMQATAIGWLRAEPSVPHSELRAIGATARIRTTDEAALALEGIIRLFQLAGHPRVYVMIDEFQRITFMRGDAQSDINAGLHGVYNSVSHGLSIILSFSFGKESNIKYFLNDEMLSRTDPQRLSVSPMSRTGAVEFLTDVVAAASEKNVGQPFTEELYKAVVDRLEGAGVLTPRRLLKATGYVLVEASMDIEDGDITNAEGKYARGVLTDTILESIVSDAGGDD